MEHKRDFPWLKNWQVLVLCGGFLFGGFLVGMLIFGSPWHLPPAWGDIPTWITAIATAGLLAGAAVTAIYAIRAFREQSKAVHDQAAMLRLQSEQLDEQRKINELQVEDLRESLKERTRLRQDAEREQADKVGFRMNVVPFPNWSLEDVDGFDVAPGELVHMAVVSNESRRPIQNVACRYGRLSPVVVGRLVVRQTGARGGSSSSLIDWLPRSSARVIRAGETYGFAFELKANRVLIGEAGKAWFTDDAGLHWHLDENLHLKQLPNREELDRWAAEEPDEFP
jgi:hypothetical protein